MTLPGETTNTTFDIKCPDCKTVLSLEVLQSNAGYYIGRFCPMCGPYSRESEYYQVFAVAEMALQQKTFGRQ